MVEVIPPKLVAESNVSSKYAPLLLNSALLSTGARGGDADAKIVIVSVT